MSQTMPIADVSVSETPLAAQLGSESGSALELEMHRGAKTPLRYAGKGQELQALLRGAAIFDLGFRSFLRATGKDRVRWLNGMITQAVKSMTPGQVAYTLVLSPQGRIQGDSDVYCHEEKLILETDRSQADRLLTHLRRFIIMDDVKLEWLDEGATALGIAGPQAAEILGRIGAGVPEPGSFIETTLAGVDGMVAQGYGPLAPHFELHLPADQALTVWKALEAASGLPAGLEALHDLRVLEGVPQFDTDFGDKHLPQEANLDRALNFTKGCYIGQEIVERIRSRATVHRSLRQFELRGEMPKLGPGGKVELRAAGAAAGELSSAAHIILPGFEKKVALGIARIEALEANEALEYDGGTAVPLNAPPAL
jgi:folate-binding protein YgfZ